MSQLLEALNAVGNLALIIIVPIMWKIKTNDLPHILVQLEKYKCKCAHKES